MRKAKAWFASCGRVPTPANETARIQHGAALGAVQSSGAKRTNARARWDQGFQ
jgi:hypothetical protein